MLHSPSAFSTEKGQVLASSPGIRMNYSQSASSLPNLGHRPNSAGIKLYLGGIVASPVNKSSGDGDNSLLKKNDSDPNYQRPRSAGLSTAQGGQNYFTPISSLPTFLNQKLNDESPPLLSNSTTSQLNSSINENKRSNRRGNGTLSPNIGLSQSPLFGANQWKTTSMISYEASPLVQKPSQRPNNYNKTLNENNINDRVERQYSAQFSSLDSNQVIGEGGRRGAAVVGGCGDDTSEINSRSSNNRTEGSLAYLNRNTSSGKVSEKLILCSNSSTTNPNTPDKPSLLIGTDTEKTPSPTSGKIASPSKTTGSSSPCTDTSPSSYFANSPIPIRSTPTNKFSGFGTDSTSPSTGNYHINRNFLGHTLSDGNLQHRLDCKNPVDPGLKKSENDDFEDDTEDGDWNTSLRAPERSLYTGTSNDASERAYTFEELQITDIEVGLACLPNKFCSKLEAVEIRKILTDKVEKRYADHPAPSTVMQMYEVSKVIGVGNYGKVREAVHRLTGARIAIKTYDKSTTNKDQDHWLRILTEIKILEKLSHPRIVRMFEAIETPKRMHIIMECCSGVNLCTYLKEKKRIVEEEAKRIFFAILQAVHYLHSIGVCHRDIKLENVLFTDNKEIKLIDFGFSSISVPGKKGRIFCGTPSYMAPEIVSRIEYEDLPTDIWSLGVLLFALIAGNFPFRAKTYPELYKKIIAGVFNIPEDNSAVCKDLLNKMLERDPRKRFTSKDIMYHSWLTNNLLFSTDVDVIRKNTPILVSDRANDDLNEKAIGQLVQFGLSRDEVVKPIIQKRRSGVATLYYLLLDFILSGRKNTLLENTSSTSKIDDNEGAADKEAVKDKEKGREGNDVDDGIIDETKDNNAISNTNTKTKELNPAYDIFNVVPTQQIKNPYQQYHNLGNINYSNNEENNGIRDKDELRQELKPMNIDKKSLSSSKINKIFTTALSLSEAGSRAVTSASAGSTVGSGSLKNPF